MPIDFNSSITSLSKKTFGNTFLSKVLGNTISISLIISLVMVLIIMIMYPAKSGTKFTIFAKMMIYIYFSVLLLIFLHDSIVKYDFKEKIDRDISEDDMNNYTRGDDIIYKLNNVNPGIQKTNQQNSNQNSNQNNNQNSNQTEQENTNQTEPENNQNTLREDIISSQKTGGQLPIIRGGNSNVNIFAL